jgi:hypothetical protein
MLQYAFITHCSKLVPPILELNTALDLNKGKESNNRKCCIHEREREREE